MFLVIPLVEFLHVLGVDINVHHENPATFLCHMSVSSVKRSRHRFASSRWHPVLSPEPRRDTRHQLGSHLSTRRHTKHHGEEMPMPFSPARHALSRQERGRARRPARLPYSAWSTPPATGAPRFGEEPCATHLPPGQVA